MARMRPTYAVIEQYAKRVLNVDAERKAGELMAPSSMLGKQIS